MNVTIVTRPRSAAQGHRRPALVVQAEVGRRPHPGSPLLGRPGRGRVRDQDRLQAVVERDAGPDPGRGRQEAARNTHLQPAAPASASSGRRRAERVGDGSRVL